MLTSARRRPLASAHQLGDVPRQRLRPERRLAEHDLADRLVDHLLEARHVRALLLMAEVDEALQAREEQLVADPHDLLDARNAHAREPHRNARRARLDILARALREDSGGVSRVACTTAKPSAAVTGVSGR